MWVLSFLLTHQLQEPSTDSFIVSVPFMLSARSWTGHLLSKSLVPSGFWLSLLLIEDIEKFSWRDCEDLKVVSVKLLGLKTLRLWVLNPTLHPYLQPVIWLCFSICIRTSLSFLLMMQFFSIPQPWESLCFSSLKMLCKHFCLPLYVIYTLDLDSFSTKVRSCKVSPKALSVFLHTIPCPIPDYSEKSMSYLFTSRHLCLKCNLMGCPWWETNLWSRKHGRISEIKSSRKYRTGKVIKVKACRKKIKKQKPYPY